MMSYINETDFVIENKELVYPEIITDGLQLYYDAKGKRDTDYHRDTMLDMSGNQNHGKLQNFAYEKHSGYKDGLVFDYIDDKLVHPELDGIDANNFTYQLNSNILAFTGGEVKIVKNGSVEVAGQNLLRNTSDELKNHSKIGWDWDTHTLRQSDLDRLKIGIGDELTLSVYIDKPTQNARAFIQFTIGGTSYRQNYGSTILQGQSGWSELTIKITSADLNNLTAISVAVRGTSNSEGTVQISNKKLEKGNAATDWIPAPEDLIKKTELKGNILGDIENIIDGLYKTEVLSSEEIYTDKSDDAVVHVGIDGKSYQHAGNGKNLAPHPKNWKYNLEASYNEITDEVIIPIGSSVEFWIRWDGNRAPVYLSFDIVAGEGFLWNTTYLAEDRSTRVLNTGGVHSNNGMVPNWTSDVQRKLHASPTIDNNVKWVLMRFSGSSSHTPSEVRMKNVKASSSSEIDYELPALTPEYPIEIHSLNDFDVVSSVGNRNLFVYDKAQIQLINIRKDSTREVFVHVGNNPSTSIFKLSSLGLDIGKIYAISFDIKALNDSLQFSGVPVYINSAISGIGFSKPRLRKDEWVRVYIDPFNYHTENESNLHIYFTSFNTGGQFELRNFKVEEVKHSPYNSSPEDISEDSNNPMIDKINLLLDEPLRSVGDVKDRLFRDSDGIWKVERKINTLSLDGTEDWRDRTNDAGDLTDVNWYQARLDPAMYVDGVGLSSHFSDITSGYEDRPHVRVKSFDTQGFIPGVFLKKDTFSTLSAFTSWLASEKEKGTPLQIQAIRETSIIETASQSLQDKLNNLRSFEDSNYVYTVMPNEDNYLSENLKPTLHAKFLYNNWYKEDRVINNLMIYNRALTNEEMLQNYKTIKRRWGM